MLISTVYRKLLKVELLDLWDLTTYHLPTIGLSSCKTTLHKVKIAHKILNNFQQRFLTPTLSSTSEIFDTCSEKNIAKS